jgi:flagellar protein FliL
MSAAAAAKDNAESPDAGAAAAPPRGKKKMIMIIAGAVLALLLAGGGGAAYYVMKKRAAAAAAATEEGEGAAKEDAHADKAAKADVKHAPTFVPLDPFTVNLADRDAERYAQVGLTLELSDAKAGELLKAYMPAIRNNILLALASKTAGELMDHEGKIRLAGELRAAALKPLGYELPAEAAGPGKKAAPQAHGDDDEVPIRAVHFSNFIIQ